MFDDPVFCVQTSRYLMDIEYAVLKLLFSNISPLWRGWRGFSDWIFM